MDKLLICHNNEYREERTKKIGIEIKEESKEETEQLDARRNKRNKIQRAVIIFKLEICVCSRTMLEISIRCCVNMCHYCD